MTFIRNVGAGRLLLVMIIGIGALSLIGSSSPAAIAANDSIAAETFAVPTYGATIVRDATATGGHALELYANSSSTRKFSTTDAFAETSLRTRATDCNGSAALVVTIDGWSSTDQQVSSPDWRPITIRHPVDAGDHQITLTMVGDLWLPDQCDRNIYVDSLQFKGTAGPVTSQTPSPSTPPSAATTPIDAGPTSSAPPADPAVTDLDSDAPVLPTSAGAPTTASGPPDASGDASGAAAAGQPGARPDGPPGRWALSYDDEFNGKSLNKSKWINCYQWSVDGCTTAGNKELEWYQPQNVSESSGSLHLTARHESTTGTDGKTYPYSSAMVTTGANLAKGTAAKFTYTYGYLEARVKLPAGQGLWPAMWLLPSSGAWPPEIDAFENLGNNPNRIFMTTHWGSDNQSAQGTFTGVDFSAGYHVIGVNWTASELTWYVDGKVAYRVTNPAAIPSTPMYVLLNLAVGGTWPGSPNASTDFPAVFDIDYLRVWRSA